MLRIIIAVTLSLASMTVQAANWFVFSNINSDKLIYFFDQDTVTKRADTVTIWEKYVRDIDQPEKDGSISSASKATYSCGNRTSQTLTLSSYDKDGNVIGTFSNPSKAIDIIPGTLGEAILTAVCSKNFPKDKSKKLYSPVVGNDIFAYAKNHFAVIKASKVDLAPQGAKWYILTYASNSSVVYFFDYYSVEKDNDRVTIWEKYVTDYDKPADDGSVSGAILVTFFCNKMTMQMHKASSYDRNGKLVASYPTVETSVDMKANSFADKVKSAVCSSDFPQENGTDLYFAATDNDVYAFSKGFFDYLKAQKNDPAPK